MPADAEQGAKQSTDQSNDDVISAERAHLTRSREFLHQMRENVLELAENPMAADRVSLEYLKADLYRRAEVLKDLPDAPLFFGRLEYAEFMDGDEDFAGAVPRGAPGARGDGGAGAPHAGSRPPRANTAHRPPSRA